jgi:hypothetical protein
VLLLQLQEPLWRVLVLALMEPASLDALPAPARA